MRSHRILVVDDEAEQRRLYGRVLDAHGFQTTTVDCAARAVSSVKSLRPDLALVDVSLPDVSGIKLLELFRASPGTSDMPVILMTGLSVPEDLVAAAAKGLDAGSIHIKGGDLRALTQRIRDALSAAPSAPMPSHGLARGPFLLDPGARTVSYEGRKVPLHGWRTLDLLSLLMQASAPVGSEDLRRRLWSESESLGIVYVTVNRLRRALSVFPAVRIDATHAGYSLHIGHAPDIRPSGPRR